MNFWLKLHKPALILAPMDDVTDIAFRQMFARYGRRKSFISKIMSTCLDPVLFTEFVSSDGLVLADEKGREKLMKKLEFKSNERPIVAQIFGSNTKHMETAAKLVEDLGFDGVDINMGCPDKSVEKTGSGAAMILNKEIAGDIIRSVKNSVSIPVSVKTRIGYDKFDPDWIRFLLSSNIDALIIHLRTRNELSKVPAHWELVDDIKRLKDTISSNTRLICNGDVKTREQAIGLGVKYDLDGIMVGRAAFGNPLFFIQKQRISKNKKIELLINHIELFNKYLVNIKSFSVMKKHFKAYIQGFSEAKHIRQLLMDTNSPQEAINILKDLSLN